MGGQNVSGAALSPVLEMLAAEYYGDSDIYIGGKVLPDLPVQVKAATFPKIERESLLKSVNLDRAPGGAYNRTSWTYTTDNYACVEKGHEEVVDDSSQNFHRDYFDEQELSMQIALDIVARQYERRVAAAIFNSSTWTPTSVGTEWSNVSATPTTDVAAAVKAIRDATGLIANMNLSP